MKTLLKHPQFTVWFEGFKDGKVRARIQARLDRVELGNYGDYQSVGQGIFELRLFFGPGYRVYFVERGLEIVILLAGGDKTTQESDIKLAIKLSNEI